MMETSLQNIKFSLLSKNKKSVCPPLITFEPTKDFHEIWYTGAATKGDLDATFSNLTASAIPKWQMFKLLRWV
jgi:hypothetical protein